METIKVKDKKTIDICSKLAQSIFIDYYRNLIGEEQAYYMANLFLSNKAIKELIDKGAIFKMVYLHNKPVAFIEYIKEDSKIFLSKLYVTKEKRNNGIGKYMLQDCVLFAKENSINKIYLTVNKNNANSIIIYEHLGFIKTNAVINDIGQGYVMNDYIMELSI